jgi:hypothetical protein
VTCGVSKKIKIQHLQHPSDRSGAVGPFICFFALDFVHQRDALAFALRIPEARDSRTKRKATGKIQRDTENERESEGATEWEGSFLAISSYFQPTPPTFTTKVEEALPGSAEEEHLFGGPSHPVPSAQRQLAVRGVSK